MCLDSKEGTEWERLAWKGCLLGHGRYPCVARGARGRLHGGNVGRDLRAERVIDIVGVGGGHHFCGAGQAKVGIGGGNDRVTATATRISVSEMYDEMKRGGVPFRTVKDRRVGDQDLLLAHCTMDPVSGCRP